MNNTTSAPIPERYRGKRFSILGDSVSTLDGWNPPGYAVHYTPVICELASISDFTDTWWGRVIGTLGGEVLVNNSWSGSQVGKFAAHIVPAPSCGCSDQRTSALGREGIDPDVIIVYLGTNDWGRGRRITPAEGEQEDLALFLPAYTAMLRKIRQNYPSAEIWCLTLGKTTFSEDPSFRFPDSYGGRSMSEYCQAIRFAAAEAGCRLIDLYGRGEYYDTVDGFHPNAAGMKTLADMVLRELSDPGSRL